MAQNAVNFVQIYRNFIDLCIDEIDDVILNNNKRRHLLSAKGPKTKPKSKIIEKCSLLINITFDQMDIATRSQSFSRSQSMSYSDSLSDAKGNQSKSDDRISDNPNKKTRKCTDCGAIDCMGEDEKHCSIVCLKCGCQQEQLLENGPEWHQYNNDDGRGEGVNRCGSMTSYYFPKSSQGTIITGFNNSRLTKKQKWSQTDYKENTLNKEFDTITKICLKNKISKKIIDTAKFFYKQVSDCKHKSGKSIGKPYIIRGGNKDGVICACVYKACETNRNPIPKKEIAIMFGKDEKSLSKGIKEFQKIIKNCDNIDILDDLHDGTPEDHIRKYAVEMDNIKQTHIDMAIRIANNCAKLKIATDHSAQSIGAGVTLLTANCFKLNIDKKDVAYWFKISDVTITKIYNKIVIYARALIDDDITEHIIEKFRVNG